MEKPRTRRPLERGFFLPHCHRSVSHRNDKAHSAMLVSAMVSSASIIACRPGASMSRRAGREARLSGERRSGFQDRGPVTTGANRPHVPFFQLGSTIVLSARMRVVTPGTHGLPRCERSPASAPHASPNTSSTARTYSGICVGFGRAASRLAIAVALSRSSGRRRGSCGDTDFIMPRPR